MSTNACWPTHRIEEFREYLRRLARSRIRRALQTKLDDSDIVQETMLKAHAKRDQFRGQTDDELAGWLRTILVNTVAETARRFGGPQRDITREESLDPTLRPLEVRRADSDLMCNQDAEDTGRFALILEIFDQLPTYQRTALELKYLKGFSVAEIARKMDCTPNAVSGLLRRGRASLRQLLAAPD